MKIDLTCPVEFWKITTATEDDVLCTLLLNNLSEKVVTSVQVTLACFAANGELIFRQTERAMGLKAEPGQTFQMVIVPTQWKEVASTEVTIEKAWFDDASIWRRNPANSLSYVPNNLPAGRALDELRFVAGKDAVGYPSKQEHVWLCMCGRGNGLEQGMCCRCHRARQPQFVNFSPEQVKIMVAEHERRLAETSKKVREENSVLVESAQKQKHRMRRKKQTMFKLYLSGACIVVVLVVSFIWGIPTLRYNDAISKLANSDFDGAREAFADMGDYRDAPHQMQECDYLQAISWLNEGSVDNLLSASKVFLELGDYQNSVALWKQTYYDLGASYLADKSFEKAAEVFQTLGNYEDSSDKLLETTYQQAVVLMEAKNYPVAKILMESLGGYKDSLYQSQLCLYEQGVLKLDDESYQEAMDFFAAVPAVEDASAKYQQAAYALATQKMAEGDTQAAGLLYLQASDVENSLAIGNDTLYQLAHEAKNEGNYQEACDLFTSISGYLDSAEQADACIFVQAQTLQQEGQTTQALAMLETIPAYSQTRGLQQELAYAVATDALKSGNQKLAEMNFELAGDYEDAAKQLEVVRYALAEDDLQNARYQEALSRFEALDSYKDSAEKQTKARYALATEALNAQDYQTAIEQFTALGNYQDSEAMLKQATYQQALALQEAGEDSKALSLLQSVESEDATAAAYEIALKQANESFEADDFETASAQYAAIEGSQEAQLGYQKSQYAIGLSLLAEEEWAKASEIFGALGDFEDAKDKNAICLENAFGGAAEPARQAMAEKDYLQVVLLLDGIDLATMTESFIDLKDIYQKACYEHAEALYAEGKPYEALPFYLRIPDYLDVSSKKLERKAYKILGEWESTTGKTMIFRADGTCEIIGESYAYRVNNFTVYTGEDANSLRHTHTINTLSDEGLSISDIRDGDNTSYKCTRVAPADLSTDALIPLITVPSTDDE